MKSCSPPKTLATVPPRRVRPDVCAKLSTCNHFLAIRAIAVKQYQCEIVASPASPSLSSIPNTATLEHRQTPRLHYLLMC